MLVGLISDTHIDLPAKKLPSEVTDALSGVDLILHAGDIWIPSVLDELESIAPVVAAWGDDDRESDLAEDRRMTREHALLLGGVKLWLMHVKPRNSLINPREYVNYSRLGLEEPPDPPDVVVFGHTHSAKIEDYKGVLLVNPGSATYPKYIPTLGSIALLTIDSGEVEARIVELNGQPGPSQDLL